MTRAANSSDNVRGAVARRTRPYLYEAAKPGGGRTMGILRAKDQRDLTVQLRTQKLVPLRSWALPAIGGGQARSVSLKDQAELHTQLAQLLTRGVPLVEALDVCASAVSHAMKPRVVKMRELVAAGSSFSDSLTAVGGFDAVTVSVYRAAERTGDLGGAAKQLAATVRRQVAVRGKAFTLMLYPMIVLTISIIVSVGMMTLVVPRIIESLKQSMGNSMPWFSELVYTVGVTIRDNAMWFGLGVLLLAVLAVVFRDAVGAALGRLMRTMPFMKDLVLAQECARFFTVMSAMTKTGVVLADALGVAEGAVSYPSLRRELTKLRTRLIEGGVLRVLIDEVKTLPLPSRRLLIAAERSGDLQQAFDTLAGDMADEVEKKSARVLAVLEPAMIIIMFLLIGSLVLSIMIPLISLTTRVQGA